MRIAVVGCLHGEFDQMYSNITEDVDLVLVCGDIQANRDDDDLSSMAVPAKYRRLGDFPDYYSGRKKAPATTIVIGGNHEASKHMAKLWLGGWLAPNIYYLGDANVIRYGGIRIGGLSGIYFDEDYLLPHFERQHCDNLQGPMIRSIYHTREEDISRLLQLARIAEPKDRSNESQPKVDIFLSHDWPMDIAFHGNTKKLLKAKPFLKENIRSHTLGSKPALDLLRALKPTYWFSAHMHCFFTAEYSHNPESRENTTHFLAQDKVLPGRRYMKVLDIPGDPAKGLEIDVQWLQIIANKVCGRSVELDVGQGQFKIPSFDSPENQTQQFIKEVKHMCRLQN